MSYQIKHNFFIYNKLTYIKHTNVDEVNVLLSKMNKTTCMFDPFPTRFLLNFLIYLLVVLFVLLI